MHCGNTHECFACFLAELSLDLERPSTNRSKSQTVLPIPRRISSPKHNHIFNTIKPLLVLTSSPSRTNTNFNTLQCSFPKPPLNTAFISPIPQNPHPSPQICSATIEKALGLRRWPLQGYDRWSGARSARFSTSEPCWFGFWGSARPKSSLASPNRSKTSPEG